MMSNAVATPGMWALEWRGWRLSLRAPRRQQGDQTAKAEALHRASQHAKGGRRDRERQWGGLLLDRALLNG